MRTFLFALFLLIVVGGGLWYRFWRNYSSELKDDITAVYIAPINDWHKILPGKWHMQWKDQSSDLGWLEEADIEYFANGEFKKHSTFTLYGWNTSPIFDTDVDVFEHGNKSYKGGGRISGKWKVNHSKGNWEEIIDSFEVNGVDRRSLVVDKHPIGNYEDARVVTNVEFFTSDSIKIIGKNYLTNGKISFFFKRTD